METPSHSLKNLFDQLGLASTNKDIEEFISKNSPLPSNIELHQAAFLTPSQSSFLQQSKIDDADWAEIVDQLDAMLR